MSNSRIEKLRQQVREMGHNLAIIEKRGLRGKDHVAKRIGHWICPCKVASNYA